MADPPKLIIAGYPAAPKDPVDRLAYYEQLTAVEGADGLEFGWSGSTSEPDLVDVLARLPGRWLITLNSVPATLAALRADPMVGLASPDEPARRAAVALAADLASSVRSINDRCGRPVVLAVEINSAPASLDGVVRPAPGAFARSLDELAAMNWSGAEVLVEHCDAHVGGQAHSKGFMTLDTEIHSLAGVGGRGLGLSLNWGRSLLELREPDHVVDHFELSAASGLLRAVTFSGAAGVESEYGPAWSDSHLPFADTIDSRYAEPTSLLTRARARAALDVLEGWDGLFIAVKTQWPSARLHPAERAASVAANFATLHDVLSEQDQSGGSH